jgi:ABC-2 type transport system permease protein
MLVDAIRAEGFRLSRNRTALFWSLAFVPILSVAIGALTSFVLKGSETKILGDEKMPEELKAALAGGTLDMADALVAAAGNLANPLVLLFVLIGAATLYAGDYRWETWRLLRPRNGRIPLVIGKVLVVTALSLIAMIVLTAATMTSEAIRGVIFNRTLGFSLDGGEIGSTRGMKPTVEIGWGETCGGNPLPAEACAIGRGHVGTVVNQNDHDGNLLSIGIQHQT